MAPNGYYQVDSVEDADVVSLDEVKLHLNIETSEDDLILSGYIDVAVGVVENYTNRWLLERTATGFFPDLSCAAYEFHPCVEVQRSPLKNVQFAYIWNGVGYDSESFITKKRSGFSRVLFDDCPSVCYENIDYPVKVEFTAGYGSTNIPKQIKQSVKLLVAAYYSNRGDCSCGVEVGGITRDVEATLTGFSVRGAFA